MDRKRTLPKRSLTIATASVFSFCPRTLYLLVASWNVLILHRLIGFLNLHGSSLHSLMNASLAVSPISRTLSNDADISCVTARPDEMLNSTFLSRSAENGSIVSSIAVMICWASSELFLILLLLTSFAKIELVSAIIPLLWQAPSTFIVYANAKSIGDLQNGLFVCLIAKMPFLKS